VDVIRQIGKRFPKLGKPVAEYGYIPSRRAFFSIATVCENPLAHMLTSVLFSLRITVQGYCKDER
jgi:hypothetical protein